MKKKGPDKYLGKRQYELHIKHLTESSVNAKLYVELSEDFQLPEYNCHAMDEAYQRKYKEKEVIRIKNENFSEFQNKILKKHWFLNENFVLGSTFLRFDRFLMQKIGKRSGWSSDKQSDQVSFLQFVRYFDRTNCLDIFKFDLPGDLIRSFDSFEFTQK